LTEELKQKVERILIDIESYWEYGEADGDLLITRIDLWLRSSVQHLQRHHVSVGLSRHALRVTLVEELVDVGLD
jgi:hypothetical protein